MMSTDTRPDHEQQQGIGLPLRRAIAQEIREVADNRDWGGGGVPDFVARHRIDIANLDVRAVLRAVAQDLELQGLPPEPPDGTILRSADGQHLWMRADAAVDTRDRDATFPYGNRRWFSTRNGGAYSWLNVHGMGLAAPTMDPGYRPDLGRAVVDVDQAAKDRIAYQGETGKLRARIGGALSLHKEAAGVGEETTRCGACRETYPCATRRILDYATDDATDHATDHATGDAAAVKPDDPAFAAAKAAELARLEERWRQENARFAAGVSAQENAAAKAAYDQEHPPGVPAPADGPAAGG